MEDLTGATIVDHLAIGDVIAEATWRVDGYDGNFPHIQLVELQFVANFGAGITADTLRRFPVRQMSARAMLALDRKKEPS